MCSEGQGGAGGLAAREVSTPPPAVLQTGAQVTLPSPSPTLGMSWASPTLQMGKPREAEPARVPRWASTALAQCGTGASPGTPSGCVCGTPPPAPCSADSEACLQHLALPPLPGLQAVLKCSGVRRAFFIQEMKLFSACCQAVVKRRGE